MLWTDKHKPRKLDEILGQKKAKEEALAFLQNWRPGKAVMLHGPAGTGKTLLVETLAQEKDFLLLRLNASDKRTAGEVEAIMGQASRQKALFHKGKYILIDEADGITGGDRGAVGAVVKLIKESRFPVFIAANDPWKPKLLPLRQVCHFTKFTKVNSLSIAKRLGEICKEEGIEADKDALKSLARWSQGDMRSALLDLQNVSQGRKSLTTKDLKSLGFRERGAGVFEILPTIFHSRSLSASRKAIHQADKDPDDIFWWVEQNMPQELKTPEELARGFELLAKADLFRGRIRMQQNWRFKAYMVDLLSGAAIHKTCHTGWVKYQMPQKIMQMGRTRARRAMLNNLAVRIGHITHCSGRKVKQDYLPYLKLILKKNKEMAETLEMTPEEMKLIS